MLAVMHNADQIKTDKTITQLLWVTILSHKRLLTILLLSCFILPILTADGNSDLASHSVENNLNPEKVE